jgi:hypothetical protein
MFVLTRTESLKLSMALWQAGSHKLGIIKDSKFLHDGLPGLGIETPP